MTQAVTLVKRALFKIGAHSEINPATPDMLAEGLAELVDLLNDWYAEGIDMGILAPTSLNTDLDEPNGSRNAIIMGLAVRVAPTARVTLSSELRGEAENAYQDLRVKFERVEVPDRDLSATTAQGEGNRRGTH